MNYDKPQCSNLHFNSKCSRHASFFTNTQMSSLTGLLTLVSPPMFKIRIVQQAGGPNWERWKAVCMGNRAKMADNMLRSVYRCTLMCFRRGVDECVLNLGDCSLNEHLSLAACLISSSLELPKGKVYIWQIKKESQIHPFLLRGMKEPRSFRVTAQSEHLSFL